MRISPNGRIRLAIAIPHPNGRCLDIGFLDSFANMEKPCEYVYMRPSFPAPIDQMRNDLIRQAQKAKCTHIFMTDTDQVEYPRDTIARLMSHNQLIACGKVHRRYPPFDPILLKKNASRPGTYVQVPEDEWIKGNLVEVDAIGAACMLMDMRIFDTINGPWFETLRGSEVIGIEGYEPEDEEKAMIGEDIRFCQKMRSMHIPIFVDTSVKVGHLATFIINEEFYLMFKKFFDKRKDT